MRLGQVDASRYTERRGTGLGLPIAKSLIELMGGKIELSSAPGQGAVFTVLVDAPLIDGPQRGAESVSTIPPVHARVLLVEDSMTNQVVFKALLERHGCQIDIVENGRLAVDKALSSDYGIVFMDINMPLLNGEDALAELKKAGYSRPVVACTANVLKADVERYMALGFDAVVGKPYLTNQLLEHIRAAIEVPAVSD